MGKQKKTEKKWASKNLSGSQLPRSGLVQQGIEQTWISLLLEVYPERAPFIRQVSIFFIRHPG